tara:strand:- start:102 stop:680 length:579 start_codon:yes stop_codon:yes gene_type:complete
MKRVRLAADRSQHELSSLANSFHSFSFGTQIDPEWMGFYSLKVFSENFLAPNGQLSLSLTHKFLKILPLTEDLEVLCKSHGRKVLEKNVFFDLTQEQAESLSLKNSSKDEASFFWIESQEYIEASFMTKQEAESFAPKRSDKAFWIHLLKGKFETDSFKLDLNDGLAFDRDENLKLTCTETGEFIWLQVPNV